MLSPRCDSTKNWEIIAPRRNPDEERVERRHEPMGILPARRGPSALYEDQAVRFNEALLGHSPKPRRQALRASARLT
ncbi:hypothetical protein BHM03_00001951 [Ensete ventricosum]|nr:hypothetical protein BHM03_00001951 [Ensete ventricosum]